MATLDGFLTTNKISYKWPNLSDIYRKLQFAPLPSKYDPPKSWSRTGCDCKECCDAQQIPYCKRVRERNHYLNKFENEYPYLYHVLKTAPNEYLEKRVGADRFHTTYEDDYFYPDKHTPDEYPELLKEAQIRKVMICPPMFYPKGLKMAPPHIRQLAFRCPSISIERSPHHHKKHKHEENVGGLTVPLGPWISEYGAGISSTGTNIINTNIEKSIMAARKRELLNSRSAEDNENLSPDTNKGTNCKCKTQQNQ